MPHRFVLAVVVVALLCIALPGGAVATRDAWAAPFTPGASGIGDPYFPLAGNGGYDVEHYLLNLRYAPSTDTLTGVATIRAQATQDLSRFDLDLVGLDVRSITIDGRNATWRRDGGELVVEPGAGLPKGTRFTAVIRYAGVPQTIGNAQFGVSGFIHTDDGTVVAGEPDGAATWYPVNDHPLDKASYTLRITVPAGVEAIANGVLRSRRSQQGSTTWTWDAQEPMAPYLTTATIGQFDVRQYRAGGIRYWDAIDPDLLRDVAPRTGDRFAVSQIANNSYKRLVRTVDVPPGGGELSFWATREIEPTWDFMFVEAHTVGSSDWTTLPDLNGHTRPDTGPGCAFLLTLHPHLGHYQTANADGTCTPTGSSGKWSAASGASDGYEQWKVDLSGYAGKRVELAISYVGDDVGQYRGVFVDDVTLPGGAGSTSFEDDGDTLDGWTVPGAPEGSPSNPNDWIAGTSADAPPSVGEFAAKALARQPEIIAFLARLFGPYPFTAAGGIVDDFPDLGFALENQTRPIYASDFFVDRSNPAADSVVLHELAHQWVGDDVALAGWQHIWLNEGFATYAEWLWSEDQGRATAQEQYDAVVSQPASNPFWSLKIGDPGPGSLFNAPVYDRGAATLHALRLLVGDDAFFRILRTWTTSHARGNVTTAEFIALAEQISGKDLDAFFDEWLFTAAKPAGLPAVRAAADAPTGRSAPSGRSRPALRR